MQTNPVQPVIEFISQHSGTLLAGLTVVLYVLKDYNVLKQLLAGIFLDVEKRFAEQATTGGHEKIEAAIQEALNLIPKRFDLALSILAAVLGTTREQLAHTIAQFVYDRVRAQIKPGLNPKG